jgi:hypothetical protein
MWIFAAESAHLLSRRSSEAGSLGLGRGNGGKKPTPINAPGESAAQLGTGSEGA